MEDSVTPNPKSEYAPDLPRLKRMFAESMDASTVERKQAAIDQDYYDGPGQWTTAERRKLRDRRQPDNYFNFVKVAINGTLGVIKQGSTDPRAYPRNPQDEDSADVASKVLRFIADHNRFDDVKIKGSKDYLISGIAAMIIEVDEDRQITTTLVRYEEFFRDPRSRREDFKDAKYMGIAKWQYVDDLAAKFPEKREELERELITGTPISVDDTMEDRPKGENGALSWSDKRKRRVLTVEMYHEERGWKRCMFYGGGVLESGDSPYLDDKKRPCNPIEAISCYVDRDNNRYGIVRDMRGPQDSINKRESKLLHRLSSNLVQETEVGSMLGADAELIRKEAARPDGVLPSGVQIVSQADKVSGEFQLLANAKDMIQRFGQNPAVVGRQEVGASGRAQLIRQQAGMTEFAIVFGGIEDWELRVYRQMWMRSRQSWTAPMYIRVTDDEGAPDFVGVNQPPTMKDPQTGEPIKGPDGKPLQGKFLPDPSAQVEAGAAPPALMQDGKPVFEMPDRTQVLGYENSLAEMDVDIIIDTVPDTANVQQEQFQVLAELAKMYPQEVTFDEMVELSTLQNKRAFLDKRKAKQEEAAKAQQPNPMQMAEAEKAKSEVGKNEASAGLDRAKTAEIMMGLSMGVPAPMDAAMPQPQPMQPPMPQAPEPMQGPPPQPLPPQGPPMGQPQPF